MVLSDIEIEAEINEERLQFIPPIDDPEDRIDSSAIDLLLHEELWVVPENSAGLTVDPAVIQIKEFLESQSEPVSIAKHSYEFKPHQLVLGKTLEYIILPNHLAARIEGKSSLARFGLSIHFTAPTVMAGFEGHLVLEMYNSGPFTIKLSHRMKIAQLILESVSPPSRYGYSGQFQEQE